MPGNAADLLRTAQLDQRVRGITGPSSSAQMTGAPDGGSVYRARARASPTGATAGVWSAVAPRIRL
ncbi:hypothetical protein ACQEV2_00215 [Streptomyces sp. CA-251387]|uniref:hypothetical protein n=1 Tax=Streptomyces sp. CA-251387 TaxID=3240064 RepID=UPI003D8C6C39